MLLQYLFHTIRNIANSFVNFDITKLIKQVQNTIFCCLKFGQNEELEIGALDAFLTKLSEEADIHIISIGCHNSHDGSQQVYPWLIKYCQDNMDTKIQISLFDPYFYVQPENYKNPKYLAFNNAIYEPDFVQLNHESWTRSIEENIYKHKDYDIEVGVYKSFPDWGFETFGKMFISQYLKPIIEHHIGNGTKFIISMHTGGAYISDNFKEMYDTIEQELLEPDLQNALILFGQIGDNPPREVLQYYQHQEVSLEEIPSVVITGEG